MKLKKEIRISVALITGVLAGVFIFNAFQSIDAIFSSSLHTAISCFYAVIVSLGTIKATSMALNRSANALTIGTGFFYFLFVIFAALMVKNGAFLLILVVLPFVIIALYSGMLKNKYFFG